MTWPLVAALGVAACALCVVAFVLVHAVLTVVVREIINPLPWSDE